MNTYSSGSSVGLTMRYKVDVLGSIPVDSSLGAIDWLDFMIATIHTINVLFTFQYSVYPHESHMQVNSFALILYIYRFNTNTNC